MNVMVYGLSQTLDIVIQRIWAVFHTIKDYVLADNTSVIAEYSKNVATMIKCI